ncbi:MAG: Acid phosphatase [uncultured bacterium]|nr:MAG: Acid phosphatase [uncultured bacterium]HBY02393.1 5'-nucleotidase, lipoprotein e(P4) family [Rikenellaceae bacterium]
MNRILIVIASLIMAEGISAQTMQQSAELQRSVLIIQDSTKAVANKEVDIKMYPVLWHQTSAEYRALCYQAFNAARTYLETLIAKREPGEKFAIVTDLDETIIDNSYLEAKEIKKGVEYSSEGWKEWVGKSAATGVPGAVDFLHWAAGQNITIFYISNRSITDLKPTLENIKKLQLPNADEEHMLFLTTESTKEPRRQTVAKDYKVVMLMGDNLNDFSNLFEKKSIDDRKAETDKVKDEWGKKFIVLPNAIYGEWENAFYDYKRNLTPKEKETKRKDLLKGF